MPDFIELNEIKIQPNTVNYPIAFTLPLATSADGPGAIPFNDVLSSVEVKAYAPDGTDVSDSMISDTSIASNQVRTKVSYFDGAAQGKYKLTIIYTTLSGYSDELDFKRVNIRNT
jgi:hypothetical protein